MAKFNGFSSSGKTHDEFVENERSPLTPQQEQQDQIRRLSRLAGQIGGIARMIEEGRSTADILMQTKAVRSALNVVEERVVQSALRDGIQRALDLGDRETVCNRLRSPKVFERSSSEIRSPVTPYLYLFFIFVIFV